MTSNKTCFVLLIALLAGFALVAFSMPGFWNRERGKPEAATGELDRNVVVANLVNNEDLIREIDPVLATLSQSVLNLRLPNAQARSEFDSKCQVRDIATISNTLEPSRFCRTVPVELKTQLESLSGTGTIWSKLFDDVHYFEHARLYAIRISDRSQLPGSLKSKTGFAALARTRSGKWRMIEASGEVTWVSHGDKIWKAGIWDFDQMNICESDQRLFEEATENCFSAEDRKVVQHSQHFEYVRQAIEHGVSTIPDRRAARFFEYTPTGKHPAVAIVDIDNDGWDDLYIMEQWRKNMLFRNRGNGTFYDATSEHELGIFCGSSSAAFADFDNDGDPDLLLGRYLERSMFLENQNGVFVDRSRDFFGMDMPFLVTSVSASDVNGDGLLDIYLSTYGFPGANDWSIWSDVFLTKEQSSVIKELSQSQNADRYLNRFGPPNYLFINRGDRFELSEFNSKLELYLNTFQSTWSDYDNDGDPDLYVSNDFAPDNLFRNDGPAGFSDVTSTVGDETMMGFGMGASWGDYDLDGRHDLYVSNMYSKAGIRITEHFDNLDRRFRRSADGNRLYRNLPEKFVLASSNEQKGLDVNKAGWSWGGQFMDVNNDCFLDLYVASGYFTAPREYATTKDL